MSLIFNEVDVAELVPSQFVSQNEIDAAKTVQWAYLNAQGQPKIEWPPSFALARAFTDQMERKGCFDGSRIGSIRASLATAERGSGADRSAALSQLVTSIETDTRRGCDDNKAKMLRKAVQDLQTML